MRQTILCYAFLLLSIPAFSQYLYPDTAFAIHGDISSKAMEMDGKSVVLGGFVQFGDKDFDPGPGTVSPQVPVGSNFYIARYLLESGELDWLNVYQSSWPPSLGPKINDLILGNDRSIWAIGAFDYEMDFDPSEDTVSLGGDETDPYIMQIDSNGQLLQVVKLEGTNVVQPYSGIGQEIDYLDGALAAAIQVFGPYESLDMDPSAATANLDCEGVVCAALARYNDQLELQWHGLIEPQDSFSSSDIIELKMDTSNNIYASVRIGGSVDLDPSPQSTIVNTGGTYDYNYVLVKLNAQGDLEWYKNFGEDNRVMDMVVETSGEKVRALLFQPEDFIEGSVNLTGDTLTSAFLTYNSNGAIQSGFNHQFINNAPLNFEFELGKYYTYDGGNWVITMAENGQVDQVAPTFGDALGVNKLAVKYGTVVSLGYNPDNTSIATTGDSVLINNTLTPHRIFTVFSEYTPPPQGRSADVEASALQVYPNPSKNQLFVQGENLQLITITSIEGKSLRESRVSSNLNSINISDLANGIYLLHALDENGRVQIRKFIKG